MLRFSILACVVCVASASWEPDYVDYIVDQCRCESEENNTAEVKYAQKPRTDRAIPSLDGFPHRELDQKTYERSSRQRPFECIAERAGIYKAGPDSIDRETVERSPAYKRLVKQCKSQDVQPICDPDYPYRSIDGTCNNFRNPKWGSVLDCTTRLLPHYYDGVRGFHESVLGGPLPEPRNISLMLHHRKRPPAANMSTWFTYFSQIVAHETADSPTSNILGDKLVECCPIQEDHHPECQPIAISPNDDFYSQFGVTCFSLTRSAPCPTCSLDRRSQMSLVTPYIDASVVYGVTESDTEFVRAFDGTGMLRIQPGRSPRYDLLPANPEVDEFQCGCPPHYCFRGGDRRASVHTPMMVLQTILLREHNRIAKKMKKINPGWEEETIYQECRKIVGAMFQHIIYNEMLPILLGRDIIEKYKLGVLECGRTEYDETVNPTVVAEFNTVAFRIHSIIGMEVSNYEVEDGKVLLRNQSFDASPIYNGYTGILAAGMAKTRAQKFDRFLVDDLTVWLYRQRKGSFGFDLPAVFIQRGRDHGIAPYTHLIKHAHGFDIRCFEDLLLLMPKKNVKLVKKAYRHVDDIDPWVGIIMEIVPKHLILGPTATILLAEQFVKFKTGDRFFYEHGGECPMFNDEQLAEIKKSSLARMVCDNSDIKKIQRNALLLPCEENPIISCSRMQKMSLSPWKVRPADED